MKPYAMKELPDGTRVYSEIERIGATVIHFGTQKTRVGTLIIWDDGVESFPKDFSDYNDIEVVKS